MKVLIVSENIALIEQIKKFEYLKNNNIQVIGLRSNLLNASQSIANDGAEIVLLDASHNNVTEIELVERFKMQHPNITFMLLTDDQSPQLLLKAIRSGLSEVIALPLTEAAFLEAIERFNKKKTSNVNTESKIYSVISCKGGSGSTFIATNLGYIFAEATHKKVLLIDLNQYFGDASLYVSEQTPAQTLLDVCTQIHRIDIALLESCLISVSENFKVLAAPLSPASATEILPEHIETILTIAKNYYDIVILDLGRQIDAITLRALDLSDKIFPVVQLVLPYIRDGKHLMEIFDSLGYTESKIGLIVNRYDKTGNLKLEDLTNSLNANVVLTVPNHYLAVNESVNQGVPIYKFSKNSPVTTALTTFAEEITGLKAKEVSLLGKLFGGRTVNVKK